jgi:A/G-specific adenine glycosylase
MLQQTPVSRVLPVWEAWMATWRSPKELAAATPAEAIRMWGNLGYPRRAVRLHATSVVLTRFHRNQVPSKYSELVALPGVGDYTANAILAFAFDQPTVVLDINVRRVLARAWQGLAHPSNSVSAVERRFAQSLVDDHLDKAQAPQWAAASMELGALICTSSNPRCEECPIQDSCMWNSLGKPDNSPRPKIQAKYEGSDRQERGRILKMLRTSHEPIAKNKIRKQAIDPVQYERALRSLITEGLVVELSAGRLSLPQSGGISS